MASMKLPLQPRRFEAVQAEAECFGLGWLTLERTSGPARPAQLALAHAVRLSHHFQRLTSSTHLNSLRNDQKTSFSARF
jgi:hypothetical protein